MRTTIHRLLILIMSLALCAGMFTASAFAAGDPNSGDFHVTGAEGSYSFADGVLTISGNVTVSTSGETAQTILIRNPGQPVTVTLNGVTIRADSSSAPAVCIDPDTRAELVLADGSVNTIFGSIRCQDGSVPSADCLSIRGSGTLDVTDTDPLAASVLRQVAASQSGEDAGPADAAAADTASDTSANGDTGETGETPTVVIPDEDSEPSEQTPSPADSSPGAAAGTDKGASGTTPGTAQPDAQPQGQSTDQDKSNTNTNTNANTNTNTNTNSNSNTNTSTKTNTNTNTNTKTNTNSNSNSNTNTSTKTNTNTNTNTNTKTNTNTSTKDTTKTTTKDNTTTKADTKKSSASASGKTPKTGDTTHTSLWAVLCAVSALGMLVLSRFKVKA